MKKYFTVYQITNKLNGMIYIGCHITERINDSYMGSGSNIKKVIKEFGKGNFIKDILFIYDNKEQMLAKELELVNKEFIARHDTYNIILGGGLYTSIDCVSVIDSNGNISLVHKTDPKYLSGELKHMLSSIINVKNIKTGQISRISLTSQKIKTGELVPYGENIIMTKDKNGKVFNISITDSRYLSGELLPIGIGKISVKDKNGKTFQVNVTDPRYLSHELVSVMKNRVVVKDKDNNIITVDTTDPRYLSGELVVIGTGKVVVKDNDGNVFKVDNTDPRYLSGELVSIIKGLVNVKDKNGKPYRVDKNDPRIKSGELVHNCNGMVKVIDTNGNISKIHKTDPRYLSGELTKYSKNDKNHPFNVAEGSAE